MRRLPLLLLSVLLGCPLAHDEPTPKACRSDDDCFVGEGEYCDRPATDEDGVCRVRLDAAAPDRGLSPDARVADRGSDLDGGLGADLDAGPVADLAAGRESGAPDSGALDRGPPDAASPVDTGGE